MKQLIYYIKILHDNIGDSLIVLLQKTKTKTNTTPTCTSLNYFLRVTYRQDYLSSNFFLLILIFGNATKFYFFLLQTSTYIVASFHFFNGSLPFLCSFGPKFTPLCQDHAHNYLLCSKLCQQNPECPSYRISICLVMCMQLLLNFLYLVG